MEHPISPQLPLSPWPPSNQPFLPSFLPSYASSHEGGGQTGGAGSRAAGDPESSIGQQRAYSYVGDRSELNRKAYAVGGN